MLECLFFVLELLNVIAIVHMYVQSMPLGMLPNFLNRCSYVDVSAGYLGNPCDTWLQIHFNL